MEKEKEQQKIVRTDSIYLNKTTTKVRCIVPYPFVASLSSASERLDQDGYEFGLIVHDKDMKSTGEMKKKHVHVVLIAKKRHRISYYINYLQMVFKKTTTDSIEVQPSECIELDFQYLTHQNDPMKYQYERRKVIHNLQVDSFNAIMDTEIKKALSALDILHIVQNSRTRTDVIMKLGRSYNNLKCYVDAFINDRHLGENLRAKNIGEV